ncbi:MULTISPECIES: hypothetical protein [unclassified Streptomyces]|uniref:hypothetical protein n=1 Tax=unclassified Streptomyces TaxID=2593676 RepID=UPI002E2B4B3B|nr:MULTISPECIES: hypothetical protein [unclassified Streptomyces]
MATNAGEAVPEVDQRAVGIQVLVQEDYLVSVWCTLAALPSAQVAVVEQRDASESP